MVQMKADLYKLELARYRFREKRNRRRFLLGLLIWCSCAWILLHRMYGFSAINGNSMRPAFYNRDFVIYRRGVPDQIEYGDVLIFKSWQDHEMAYVKRVVALPGDVVKVDDKSYMDESLETEIRRIMKQYDVQTKQIWFELTELTDVKDKDVLKHLIEKLNKKGFCFALDDFGKGQSNLIRLFDYNFQSIKFDKELVWKMDESKLTVSMLRHIVEFAHENNICITAEGVENTDMAKTLINIHCDFLQGFLISRPLPIDDFISLVNNFSCRPYVPENRRLGCRA